MKHVITSRVTRIALAAAIAAIVVPTASAQGGAVSHVYAPPPLDAGSAVPNPDYVGSSSAGEGFDWSDAGIGAAGTFAVVVVAAGSALGVQRSRQRTASA